jgi:cation transport regulator ChaC
MSSLLYFAYGSNMLRARLQERVPGAQPRGIAILKGYALRWHKVGKDQSGKADIVETQEPGGLVHGVLYEISLNEKPALDDAEGLGHGYEEKNVLLQQHGKHVQAFAYFAIQTSPDVQPFTWYKSLVVAGAIENKLPQQYIDALKAVPARLDTDQARHAKHMQMASAAA